ncbi:MAG: hypothetical protein SFZ23_13730 [Planctomycetota bacterium]|nr:hypothetical protein [Planctomycetota bacterium]
MSPPVSNIPLSEEARKDLYHQLVEEAFQSFGHADPDALHAYRQHLASSLGVFSTSDGPKWNPLQQRWETWDEMSGDWIPVENSDEWEPFGESEDDEEKDSDPQECGFVCGAIAWGYSVGKWAAGMWGTVSNAVDGIDWSTVGHTVLDVGGLIEPFGIGIASDAVNAAWHGFEGNWLDAALSAISIVPVVGDAIGKGGKVAIRAGGAALRKFIQAIKEFGGLDKIREFFSRIPGEPGKRMREAFEGFYREARDKFLTENANVPFAATKWADETEAIYKRMYGDPVWSKGGNRVWFTSGDSPYLVGDHASLLEFKRTFAETPFGNNPPGAFKGWDSHHVIEAIDLENLGLQGAREELYRRLPAVLLPPEGHARITSILSSYRPFKDVQDLREAYEIAYDTLGLPADDLMDILDEILVEGVT